VGYDHRGAAPFKALSTDSGAWRWPLTLRSVARPEGLEQALPTIVVEGVSELVELLRAA
jgi:hypothetical protein